jgi:transposase
MKTIIGIDVSKDCSSFCVLNRQSEVILENTFPMTADGFESFLRSTQTYRNSSCVMESTGRYHLTLAAFLLNRKRNACIVNPSLVKNFTKTETLRKSKTDKIDAGMIARFAQRYEKTLHSADPSIIKEITPLARRREHIAEDIAKVKTQLKADLNVAFPEILTYNVFTDTALSFLIRYPSASAVMTASEDEMTEVLQSVKRGRCVSFSPSDLKKLAEKSIGVNSYGALVSDSARQLLLLRKRLKTVTKEFLRMINTYYAEEMEIITSIDGVGEITAAHFLAEIGSISRFSRYQKLIAFCGTDPAIYQSGTVEKNGKITKKGNRNLRKYVYLMASGLIKFNPYFRSYYDKKRNQGFQHRKAMVALMNKLLRSLYAMLSKKEVFNNNYLRP